MNKRTWILLIGFFCGVLVIGTILALFRREEWHNEYASGNVSFDSTSILRDLSLGRSDVFMPIDTTPAPSSPLSSASVNWSQRDYLSVANALHVDVWNEPISSWKLNYMVFRTGCKLVADGPQAASFSIWTNVGLGFDQRRIEHRIDIDPLYDWAAWSDVRYSAAIDPWPAIDTRKLGITADDALGLAEEHGGMDFRLAHNDKCTVYETLAPHAQGRSYVWDVRYSGSNAQDALDLQIDAITGRVIN